MDVLVVITNVAIGIEVAVAVVLTVLNFREVRFLDKRVRPLLDDGEDLPLFDALNSRAKYVTAVAAYLIIVTALGAAGIRLTELFPPLRAVNGALLLGLIAGPRWIGSALRQRAERRARS